MATKKSAEKAPEKPVEDASVKERIEVETSQGFRGLEVDPTPNENYTIAGVTKGKPTPETNKTAFEKAQKSQSDLVAEGDGPGPL